MAAGGTAAAGGAGGSVGVGPGTLWVWGNGNYGSLGLGDTISKSVPTQLGTSADWTWVTGSQRYSVGAVNSSGEIWMWGNDALGQLGQGNTGNHQSSPVQVGSDTDWVKVSVSPGRHTVALKSDGSLWAWGTGGNGQLGAGNTASAWLPQQIGTDTDWETVVAINSSTIGIKTDGSLWAWGNGNNGVLGHNNETDYSVPTQVGTDTDWAGGFLSDECDDYNVGIVKANGKAYVWGRNRWGNLGLGHDDQVSSPVQLGSDSDWMMVAPQQGQGMGTKQDGSFFVWGRGTYGRLGLGNTTTYYSPVQQGSDATQYGFFGSIFGNSLKTDGTIWSWGYGHDGKLGVGNTTNYTSPVLTSGGSNWVMVTGHEKGGLAIKGS